MPDLNAVLEEEETEDPERLDLEPTAEEEDDDDEELELSAGAAAASKMLESASTTKEKTRCDMLFSEQCIPVPSTASL